MFSDISDTELVSTCEKAESSYEPRGLYQPEFSDISDCELISTCEQAEKAATSVPTATATTSTVKTFTTRATSRFPAPKTD